MRNSQSSLEESYKVNSARPVGSAGEWDFGPRDKEVSYGEVSLEGEKYRVYVTEDLLGDVEVVMMSENGDRYNDSTSDQPGVHGDKNRSLTWAAREEASMPETDEELEAYARYVLSGKAEGKKFMG